MKVTALRESPWVSVMGIFLCSLQWHEEYTLLSPQKTVKINAYLVDKFGKNNASIIKLPPQFYVVKIN